MMRKMFSAVLVCVLVATVFLVVNVGSEGLLDRPKDDIRYPIYGTVFDAGGVEIWDDVTDNWSCTNITVYSVDGTVDVCVDDASTDQGETNDGYDTFLFDSSWRATDVGKEGVCIGEAVDENNIPYVFITNFTFIETEDIYGNLVYRGEAIPTEWEPIPTPIIYAKGDTRVNLAIPKFANPQKELYDNITSNTDNTVGFAVYRNGLFVGNTTSEGTAYYFFNDTDFSSACNYSVSPILKGNYVAYGRSASLSSDESALAPLNVVLESPNGDEYWAGGSEQNIKYTISGGLTPYTVTLKYSTGAGDTYPNTINTTVKEAEGECTYAWTLPENSNAVKVQVEVTDDALVSKNDASDNTFIIDSTAPTIKSTIPPAGGSVSIKKPVTIVFREEMNKTATVSAFSISPTPGGWAWTWNTAGDTMTGTHNDFVFDTTYTATITTAAKDLAGNYLAEDHSWNFTASMGVCLNSPKYGDVWTGGEYHGINYTLSGGVPNYEVKIYYSYNGGNWSFIEFDNRTVEGIYEYLWTTCPSINSKTVNVKIVVVDGNDTESMDTSGNFEVDSTAPTIVDYSGSAGIMLTTESVMIVFSEKMNKASAKSAFSLKDADDIDVNGTFSWDGNVMSFTPNAELASGTDYTVTINTTAKDKSDPGNSLNQTYSWAFKAVQGRRDLIISLSISPSPEKGKTSTVTVTASNTGPEADNLSGFLTVKFYESSNGETWTLLDTKYIQNIGAGNSSYTSTAFTFDDYGSYYFRVEVTSNNPTDTFPGGEKTGRASASCNILKPGEEIGLGPYTLIALMVVIVVIAAALILLNLKKKGELTLKEKTKEETEEGEKEEEEIEKEESEEEEEKG